MSGLKINLGIVGLGNMAEALIAGLLNKKIIGQNQIIGFEINPQRRKLINKKYRIRIATDLNSLAHSADLILLAIKPQQMTDLLQNLAPLLRKQHLIASIAAGIDTRCIANYLKQKPRLIRIMPNTPALIGMGQSAFFASPACSKQDRVLIRKLLGAVGTVIEIPREDLLDAVTGLSGSGPAYIYLILESLIQGGIQSGLKRGVAQQLLIQTVHGATQMIAQSGENPQTLIQRVTSKGGTTEAGLKVLAKYHVPQALSQCVVTATKRARQLRVNARKGKKD